MVDKVAIQSYDAVLLVDPSNQAPVTGIQFGEVLAGGSGVVTRDGHLITLQGGVLYDYSLRSKVLLGTADLSNTLSYQAYITTHGSRIVILNNNPRAVYALNSYQGDITQIGVAPDFYNSYTYFSNVSQDGYVCGAEEDTIYYANVFHNTEGYISWNQWPGKVPQFNEGTENNTAGGTTFRSNQDWLDVDAAGAVADDTTGRFYWCGFNESTNLEEVVMGRSRHNMYFASAPFTDINAWRIDHQAFIPAFGEFPDTYPAFGNAVMTYPWYVYADGGHDSCVLSWNVETNETRTILTPSMLPSNLPGYSYYFCLSGNVTLTPPRLRQYPREDGLGANNGPRQRTKTMGTSRQSSIRQGIRNTYT